MVEPAEGPDGHHAAVRRGEPGDRGPAHEGRDEHRRQILGGRPHHLGEAQRKSVAQQSQQGCWCEGEPQRGHPALLDGGEVDGEANRRRDLARADEQQVLGPAHEHEHAQRKHQHADRPRGRDPGHHLETLEQPALLPRRRQEPQGE